MAVPIICKRLIAARAGDYKLAQRILNLAGSAINETPGAMLVSAVSEYELGNYSTSADMLGRLSARQPGNLRVRRLLARAKMRAGRTSRRARYHQAACGRRRLQTLMMHCLLPVLSRPKVKGGARRLGYPMLRGHSSVKPGLCPRGCRSPPPQMVQSAIPTTPRYVIPYIRALLLQGKNNAALVQAKRLQARNPGVADSHMLVGDVQAARGGLSRRNHRLSEIARDRIFRSRHAPAGR